MPPNPSVAASGSTVPASEIVTGDVPSTMAANTAALCPASLAVATNVAAMAAPTSDAEPTRARRRP